MTVPAYFTEDQIERAVERMVDKLDQRFLSTAMTQEQYDAKMREIDEWAEDQYRWAKACKEAS